MNNKEKVKASLDKLIPSLEEVSDWMYENPELGFEEYKTSEHLINYMRSNGLEVKTPVGGLDTAFSSSIGSSGPLVVLCVEYDALPEIGHACGHNIIATASIGAGIALKEIAEDLKIRERNQIAFKSTIIAFFILITFAYVGRYLLEAIGVSLDSLKIAGGVILMLLAIDILFEKRKKRSQELLDLIGMSQFMK